MKVHTPSVIYKIYLSLIISFLKKTKDNTMLAMVNIEMGIMPKSATLSKV